MNTRCSPRELAVDLLNRSSCNVKVAAVLSDSHGIFAWGWNSSGADGNGMHAEEHVFSRANRKRLVGAMLTVASIRTKTGKFIYSKPCTDRCLRLANKFNVAKIEYITQGGKWEVLNARFI